jgi:hypothetical protein
MVVELSNHETYRKAAEKHFPKGIPSELDGIFRSAAGQVYDENAQEILVSEAIPALERHLKDEAKIRAAVVDLKHAHDSLVDMTGKRAYERPVPGRLFDMAPGGLAPNETGRAHFRFKEGMLYSQPNGWAKYVMTGEGAREAQAALFQFDLARKRLPPTATREQVEQEAAKGPIAGRRKLERV